MSVTQPAGIVLIHGAGLAGNVWSEVQKRLDAPSVAVDLPHRGSSAATRSTFDDYVGAVVDQTAAVEPERVVLVAHSIGGVVALGAAEALGDRLAGIVGVSAAIPRPGGSFLSCLPLPKRLLLRAVMTVVGTRPPAAAIRSGQASDLAPAEADAVVSSFTAEALSLYTTPVRYSLPAVPRRYLLTTADKEFAPALQRRMTAVLGDPEPLAIESGHLPMLTRPDDVAAAINEVVSTG